MFETQSEEQVMLLQQQETSRYKPASCRVQLDDGLVVEGMRFAWVSDIENLREGVFDLGEFQRRSLEGWSGERRQRRGRRGGR